MHKINLKENKFNLNSISKVNLYKYNNNYFVYSHLKSLICK